MKLHYILVLFSCGLALGNIVRNVRLLNHVDYMIEVVSQTVEVVEGREWCNLKVPDPAPIPIDEVILGWHAKGNVRYYNGFVVSIEDINLLRSISSQIITNKDNVAEASIRGTLRMHNVAVGYDVQADLEDGVHRYTAKYVYHMVDMGFHVTKIMNSNTISVAVDGAVTVNQRSLPVFMPPDRLSDALTTLFNAAALTDGIVAWGPEVFQPIAQNIVNSQVKFPEVCYNCPG